MKLTSNQIDEINAIRLFDPQNPLDGIKTHSDASPEVISAINSLFDKGLITQADGGYLTDIGKRAAEHADALLGLLK